MGIHDRDYYRESASGMFDAWGRTSVTVWLIVVSCVVFVAQVVSRDANGAVSFADSPVARALIYNPDRVLGGEVWRLVTSVFLHGGLLHLVFNMLVLYWAGSRLEDQYGGREFLLFYLTAALFAGVVRFGIQVAGLTPASEALGASGAVTAVLVLFAFHYPYQRVMLWFLFPVPVWALVVVYVALDALGALGAGRVGIGYVAHLGGALFGLLYYQFGRRLSDLIPGLPSRTKARRAPPRLRVVTAEPDDADEDDTPEPVPAAVEAAPRAETAEEPFETRVDRVLDKVSKYGQESLTAEERELLFRASEVYKKRRK